MLLRNALLLFLSCWMCWPSGAQPESMARRIALERIRSADQSIERREYQKAEALYKQALVFFEEQGDCYHQAYCYLWLSEASYGQNAPAAQSIELARRSKSIADACAQRDQMPFYSLILQNLGVFHSELGDFDRQMAYYRQAFEEVLRFDGRQSERGADAYQNLGVAFGSRGQWDRAIAYLDTSLQLSEQLEYGEGIATACHNLAYAFETKKDYIRAVDYQRRALRLSEDPVVIARGHNNLGTYYSDLGEPATALDHLEESLCLREALFDPDDDEILSNLLNIAGVYFDYGHLGKADEYVDWTIDQWKAGDMRNSIYLKLAYHYKAHILHRSGHLAEAEAYLRQAMALSSYDPRHQASTLLILAEVLSEEERYDEALGNMQQALGYEVEGFTPSLLYENPPLKRIQDLSRGLDLLRQKARLLYRRGAAQHSKADLAASLNTYRLADSLISRSRRVQQHRPSRESLAASAQQLYAGAIAAAHALYDLTGDPECLEVAFGYSEKNKSMLVLEKMHDLYAKKFHDIPAEWVEREQQLLADIEFYSTQLRYYRQHLPAETEKISSWETVLFKLNRRQEELLAAMRREYPDYFQLKHDLSPPSLAEVEQGLLKEDEVFIEYFVAEDALYIFLISLEERKLVKVPLETPVAGLVDDFRRALISQDSGFYASSHGLYRLLIAPISDKIEGRSLVIVPDGALGYLPFETLLAEAVPPERYDDHRRLPYLIRRCRLRYCSSAGLALKHSTSGQEDAPGEVLVMAPSFDGLSRGRADSTEELRRLYDQLSPLPGSREEVDLIRRRFHGTFLVGDAARESALKEAGKHYGMVHITTHTLIDERFPSLSKLVFSEKEEAEDGFLNVYELYNTPLEAELVVLSACNTGIGTIVRGEGIASLARAFAYAGSPSLVMSLWPVQDRSSPALMGRFYDHIKAGMTKGEALRQAKLDFLDRGDDFFTHPYYWASFVYSGNRAPIFLQVKGEGAWRRFLVPVLGIFLASLALLLLRRRRWRIRASGHSPGESLS